MTRQEIKLNHWALRNSWEQLRNRALVCSLVFIAIGLTYVSIRENGVDKRSREWYGNNVEYDETFTKISRIFREIHSKIEDCETDSTNHENYNEQESNNEVVISEHDFRNGSRGDFSWDNDMSVSLKIGVRPQERPQGETLVEDKCEMERTTKFVKIVRDRIRKELQLDFNSPTQASKEKVSQRDFSHAVFKFLRIEHEIQRDYPELGVLWIYIATKKKYFAMYPGNNQEWVDDVGNAYDPSKRIWHKAAMKKAAPKLLAEVLVNKWLDDGDKYGLSNVYDDFSVSGQSVRTFWFRPKGSSDVLGVDFFFDQSIANWALPKLSSTTSMLLYYFFVVSVCFLVARLTQKYRSQRISGKLPNEFISSNRHPHRFRAELGGCPRRHP